MISVKYSGFFESFSGMAEAARSIVASLAKTTLNIITEPIANTVSTKSLGENYTICRNLPHEGAAEFKIFHITPDMVTKYFEPMTTHIFHLFWETDSLPEWWVWSLNMCDEVWTGSSWNQESFLRSGVKKPVWVCPQPVKELKPEEIKPFVVPDRPAFLFYSMFQWIERKDPELLLKTFWKTFAGRDDVGLALKTYKERFTTQEKQEIVNSIVRWKAELNLPKFPPIYLYLDELSRHDCLRFHMTGDCFVSSHHGEGWGVCQAEAMALGKPVISTDLGGIHEHVPKDLWYPVSYTWESVHGMDFIQWYDKSQQWGKADPNSLAHEMIAVTTNTREAQERAGKSQAFVRKHLNPVTVGNLMKERLEHLKRSRI